MKRNHLSIISLFLSIVWTTLLSGAEPFAGLRAPRRKERKTKNYYELIGISGLKKIFDDAEKEAKKKAVEQTESIQKLKDTIRELEGKFEEAADKKALEAQIEKLRADLGKRQLELRREQSKAFVEYLQGKISHDDIVRQCEKKREELQEKRKKLDRQLSEERLAPSEHEKKSQELLDVLADTRETTHACPILLNEKSRKTYDQSLSYPPPAEARSLIEALRQGISGFISSPPDTLVMLNDIAGTRLADQFGAMLEEIFGDIPEPAAKIFNQKIALRSFEFLQKPGGGEIRYWVGFSALMALNQFEVRLSMYLIQDIYGSTQGSISVELPEHYKISNLIPKLTYLDTFSLPKTKLVFSDFEYFDGSDLIRRGMNLVAEVDLSGPLQVLHDLKEKSKRLKSLVFENEPIKLTGYLARGKILDSDFEISVPFHFGFDLRKISVIPQGVSKVVNQITTDDFRLTISPGEKAEVRAKRAEKLEQTEALASFREFMEVPAKSLKETELAKQVGKEVKQLYPKKESRLATETTRFAKDVKGFGSTLAEFIKFNIEAEAGARIVLGTQEDPLRLTLLGSIRPAFDIKSSSLLLAANLKNMLELKWLALGDATIQFQWDAALMEVAAAVGIPFTGFGLKGKLDLGKPGDSRAHFDLAGGFSVSSSEVPDLLFSVEGSNIRFADLLSYASYLAYKARILKSPVSLDRIPTMTFETVRGYASLGNMRIGDRTYHTGLGIQVEADFFNKKFGLGIDMDNHFKLFGFGYMPRVDATIRGKELFKLYGSTDPNRGPRAQFEFDPEKLSEGRFLVDGVLEIPSIRLKQDVEFEWNKWTLDTTFKTTLGGITVLFGVSFNVSSAKAEEERGAGKEEEERGVGKEEEEAESVFAKASSDKEGEEKMEEGNEEEDPLAELPRPRPARGTAWQRLKRDVAAPFKKARATGKRARTATRAWVGKKLAPARAVVVEKVGKPVREFVGKRLARPAAFLKKGLGAATEKFKAGAARQFFVKFGFTHEFASYMTKSSANLLKKMKESATRKLKAAMDKMLALKASGAQGLEAAIEQARRSVARTEEKIARAKKECGQARWYKKYVCAKVAAYQTALASKKSYLHALLRPTKGVVTGVTQVVASTLRKIIAVQEFALEVAITGLEFISKGLDVFQIKEIYGEYSAQDVLELKLPMIKRFIVEINYLFDEPRVIQLYDIQFDLKNPWAAVADITQKALTAGLTASVGEQAMGYAEMLQPLAQ